MMPGKAASQNPLKIHLAVRLELTTENPSD